MKKLLGVAAVLSLVPFIFTAPVSALVACGIGYMADRLGGKFLANKAKLQLSITQQEIANALGLSCETAGIMLKKLEIQKIIGRSRSSYVLYIERLRKYLEHK